MHVVGRSDVDGFHIGIRYQFLIGTVSSGDTVLLCKLLRFFRAAGAHSDELFALVAHSVYGSCKFRCDRSCRKNSPLHKSYPPFFYQ